MWALKLPRRLNVMNTSQVLSVSVWSNPGVVLFPLPEKTSSFLDLISPNSCNRFVVFDIVDIIIIIKMTYFMWNQTLDVDKRQAMYTIRLSDTE